MNFDIAIIGGGNVMDYLWRETYFEIKQKIR